jgi:hypothetical protein
VTTRLLSFAVLLATLACAGCGDDDLALCRDCGTPVPTVTPTATAASPTPTTTASPQPVP